MNHKYETRPAGWEVVPSSQFCCWPWWAPRRPTPGRLAGAQSPCQSPVKGAVREEEGPVLPAFSFGIRS